MLGYHLKPTTPILISPLSPSEADKLTMKSFRQLTGVSTNSLGEHSYLLCNNNIQVNVSMNEVAVLVPADCAFNAH